MLICDRHDLIIEISEKIEKCIERANECVYSNDIEGIESEISDIADFINEIKSEAEDAKESGQDMENRLSEYRNAIEDLGFTRN